MSNQETWFIAHILSGRLRMLDECEQARFDELRESDAACRNAYEAALTSEMTAEAPVVGHLPAAMLSRWDRAVDSLTGIERAAARRHLESCGRCRGALEMLGHSVEIPRDPDVELTAAVEQSVFPHRHESPAFVRPHSRRIAPTRRLTWIMGGWATLATAAAVVFMLQPQALVEEPGPGLTINAPTSRLAADGVFVRLTQTRSAESTSVPKLTVGSAQHLLQVDVGGVLTPRWLEGHLSQATDRLRIVVRTPPRLTHVLAEEKTLVELEALPILRLVFLDEPLAAGRYSLALEVLRGNGHSWTVEALDESGVLPAVQIDVVVRETE